MDVTKKRAAREKIIEEFKDYVFEIDRGAAYFICKDNNLEYPFPDAKYVFDEAYDRASQAEEDRAYDEYNKIIVSKDAPEYDRGFNIFQPKYYDPHTQSFKLPLAEIVKNYLLCYSDNVADIRKGNVDDNSRTYLKIFEFILQNLRSQTLGALKAIDDRDPRNMTAWEFRQAFPFKDYGDQAVKDQQDVSVMAGATLNDFLHSEQQSPDYQNRTDEIAPKQIFFDLVSEQINGNPETKRALAVYLQTQSDEAVLSQLKEMMKTNSESYLKKGSLAHGFSKAVFTPLSAGRRFDDILNDIVKGS